jgi:hypothetical protein
MGVYLPIPGQLAVSRDGQTRVLFARKAVDLLLDKVVVLVLCVGDGQEVPVVLGQNSYMRTCKT